MSPTRKAKPSRTKKAAKQPEVPSSLARPIGFSEPVFTIGARTKKLLRNAVLVALGVAVVWRLPGFIADRNLKKDLVPFTYQADPGQTGGFAYVDETGTQLNDGVLGLDDWKADQGHGTAYEWVGWRDVDPVITLDLGDKAPKVAAVLILASHGLDGGVFLPKRIELSSSLDGVIFGPASVTPVSPPGKGAHWVRVDAGGLEARYLRLKLLDDDPGGWVFVSEIRVLRTRNSP